VAVGDERPVAAVPFVQADATFPFVDDLRILQLELLGVALFGGLGTPRRLLVFALVLGAADH
jgi:hypothetical protein